MDNYNGKDEELSRLHAETERRKRELEQLQREELRRIRELERARSGGSTSGYSPELDSAFIEDGTYTNRTSAPSRATGSVNQNRQSPYPGTGGQVRERNMQQSRGSAPANSSERGQRNPQPARRRRQTEEEYTQPVRKRMYDADQSVSDEEYSDSYERPSRQSGSGSRRSGKKKKGAGRVLRRILFILLILLLIFGLAIWNITRKFNHVDTEVSDRADSMKHQIINVLLIGQDARDGETDQRSDSMIILSINQKKNTACMISIMRDTYVDIPGYGGNRINAAYAYGGIDLLDQTIEENFGIAIDGNAMVDFDGFLEAMTAVGSLKMDLTAEEAEYMNANPALGSNNDVSDEVWELTEGTNSLTPSQILCYSRMRYVGNSDWDRTERQRKVISGVTSEVKHGHLIKGYNVASKAAPSITTDIKTFGMLRIASGIMTSGDMASYIVPVEGTYYSDYVNGMAVLVPDLNANRSYIEDYINGDVEEETEDSE